MDHVPKLVIAGYFVLCSFAKRMQEFKTIIELVERMGKEGVFVEKELEDSTLVVMANFYDLLIDCPTAMERLDVLLDEWKDVISAEMNDKCKKYAEEVKNRLEEEYRQQESCFILS
eukprot:TRINITY_DN4487_c0_g2_i1.p1 TRINITY_DN4487_c0_g2~~TRINITY_DN4487_c0_g2_i1.p1  ORF type:complete len:116 (+),score=45.62 TRINITY_DN4487_c0_g2_i1:518-865(+)